MAAGSRGKTALESKNVRTAPGAHLRAELRRLGLDQVAVSKATGVSRQSVNNIINGRQAISRAMAGKLGRLTGHSSDYWLSDWFGDGPALPARGLAGPLVDHQIASAVEDGVVVITPFKSQHLRAASIDLTVGTRAVVGNKKIKLSASKTFSLKPGASLIAETAERVELPFDYVGRVGGKAQLIADGLFISVPLQIEPGFKGLLVFGLLNAGPSAVMLRSGDPVVTLEIVRLGTAAEHRSAK